MHEFLGLKKFVDLKKKKEKTDRSKASNKEACYIFSNIIFYWNNFPLDSFKLLKFLTFFFRTILLWKSLNAFIFRTNLILKY